MRNVNLKAAIFKAGTTQRGLARKANIPESYLSLAVNGKFILNEDQKGRISTALGQAKEKLFNSEGYPA